MVFHVDWYHGSVQVWVFLPFLQYFKQFNVFGDIPELQIWQLYESYEKYPPCMPELCWSNALIGYPIFTNLASTFKSPLNHLKSLFHEMPNLALDTDRENKRTRFFSSWAYLSWYLERHMKKRTSFFHISILDLWCESERNF